MFISKDINQKKILEFVEKFKEVGSLQQFGIYHNDELKIKFSINPYLESDSKQLFSVSKSFTSMAIGKAIDNGLLDIHDKVIKFFSVPNPSERLAKMEIFHLITMTTGHDRCVMPLIGTTNDPVRAFFNLDIPYEPGTYFAYNSAASLILSVIINKVTGMSVNEYIKDVYDALNIDDHYFESIEGISMGATGLHLNIDALLSFGQFLLHEGNVNGKQIISKEYIKAATSKQVSNDLNGTLDWTKGYGYHIWRGEEGYRCDGAFGQLIMVLPKKNMVIACQACVNNMQDEVNLIKDLIRNLYGEDEVLNLEAQINNVYKIEKTNEFIGDLIIELEANKLDLNSIKISSSSGRVNLHFDGKYSFEISAGNGYYIKNSFYAVGIKRKLSDIMPSFYEESVVSCYYLFQDNRLEIVMKNHNTPLIQSIIIDYDTDCKVMINEKIFGGNLIINN